MGNGHPRKNRRGAQFLYPIPPVRILGGSGPVIAPFVGSAQGDEPAVFVERSGEFGGHAPFRIIVIVGLIFFPIGIVMILV